MMTPQQIRTIIERAGLPVVYRAWQEGGAPALPWVAYYAGQANNFAADGTVYFGAQHYIAELYTEDKDPETEQKLEAAFTAAGLFWTKDETFVESERMFKITYEIEG